ncbi:MAG: hypothetical protein WKF34_11900 [Pyrinomonadaceae bacterium]
MSSKKERSDIAIELNAPYEQNEIELKGIFGFAIGLFLLIVVTFALMWALLNVLKDYSEENAGPVNPMIRAEKDRLPAAPRLQLAPGFGVESPNGRINMELGAPQAEYRELKKQWDDLWLHGHKDKASGATTAMPINEAKDRFLTSGSKAKAGTEAETILIDSKRYISDASSGRVASITRR